MTSPLSTQRFAVSMTHAKQRIDSKPPASSLVVLAAFGQLCMALIVATGWPLHGVLQHCAPQWPKSQSGSKGGF